MVDHAPLILTGPTATHRIACHNPPTAAEAAAGRPLRDGFKAAPPPEGYVDELSGARIGSSAGGETSDVLGSPASPYASAGGLPIEADDDRGTRHG